MSEGGEGLQSEDEEEGECAVSGMNSLFRPPPLSAALSGGRDRDLHSVPVLQTS